MDINLYKSHLLGTLLHLSMSMLRALYFFLSKINPIKHYYEYLHVAKFIHYK